MSDRHILITGGAGFIGSEVVNLLTENHIVVVIDRLDYCSRKANWRHPDKVIFYQMDINKRINILKILRNHTIDTIMHFAAQTHVDNSFDNVADFIRDNIKGTSSLLEVCREYGKIARFIHVSTDEVYGEVPFDQVVGCKEDSALHPTNPYAATKASAEHIAWSYMKSYGIPIIMTRSNNIYGIGQYPEKVIPKFCLQMLLDKPVTIHGNGTSQRTFIYVEDVARAFLCILEHGKVGETYNIGSTVEYSVNDIAQILHNKIQPTNPINIVNVKDRNFNDCRYHINSDKIHTLGWSPQISFEEGLNRTIEFYRTNLEEFKGCV